MTPRLALCLARRAAAPAHATPPRPRLRAPAARRFGAAPHAGAANPAGIHDLPERLRRLAFGSAGARQAAPAASSPLDEALHGAALRHLAQHGLLGQRTTPADAIDFDLPRLLGAGGLDEHFQKIGNHMLEPFMGACTAFAAAAALPRPAAGGWVLQSGWTRYAPGAAPERVDFPAEDAIVFDTEVLYELSSYPVIATAVSATAYYVWLSPWLLKESRASAHLVPLGPHRQTVVGHYVAYDRQRVQEEYSLQQSPKWYLDTMSLHIATNGMCNQQRPVYMKYEKLVRQLEDADANADADADADAAALSAEDADRHRATLQAMLVREPWLRHTAPNGLDDVVRFHLGESMDKSPRDYFRELSVDEAAEPAMLQRLITYCALDSWYTKRVFGVLLPKFRALNPHPVSFGALRSLASTFLPITEDWQSYLDTAEMYYAQMLDEVNGHLRTLADEAAAYADDKAKLEEALRDPWLSQLDWTVKPIRYTKAKGNAPPRLAKNQKMPGKPEWYKSLFSGTDASLTVRTRVTPLLLRLTWDGHPLYWSNTHGWAFWVNGDMKEHYLKLNFTHAKKDDAAGRCLFKLPHPDGEKGRCTNPFAKSFLPYFESGMLRSSSKVAMDAITSNLECAYWISSRQRILDQMAVYQNDGVDMGLPPDWGMILPRLAPIGAVTRRAVEDTWLTASNAKKNRIGSELKANVRAPPGYTLVGADVDSEELWIASVVGDSLFKMHGGTAMGWMTLEGTKQAGTDLHSKSAQILGISRNEAKVFNYGRIYGAGQPSASRKLKEFNPSLSVAEAERKARALYSSTKGTKTHSKHFPLKRYWRGGTESVVYNQLELLAEQPRQRTPVLGAGITDALCAANLKTNSYLTTRVNWSIQSSGVDYLHLLIASVHYLSEVYGIGLRLLLTVHDEVRFLVKDEDKYRAALALQIANLWTRAMFCEQLGLNTIPYSVAFFSLIDFDAYFRKEVDDPCVTPSHPEALPPGEALSMQQLLEKCASLGAPDLAKLQEFERQPAAPRKPVMADINESPYLLEYVNAQIGSEKEARSIEARLRGSPPGGSATDTEPASLQNVTSRRRSRKAASENFAAPSYGTYRGARVSAPPQPAELRDSHAGSVSMQITQPAQGRALRYTAASRSKF